jgi:hypothetical protein
MFETQFTNYKGKGSTLASAIGAYCYGYHFGWKALGMIHSQATIRKYNKILGVDMREIFDDETPAAVRSVGMNAAKDLGGYWKIATGKVKVKNKDHLI